MEDEGSAFGRCKNFRKDLSEGLPFHVDVSACVAHCRILIPQPVSELHKFNGEAGAFVTAVVSWVQDS